MLRVLKKYTFGYHVLPKTSAQVPGRSIIMSSYPGALSSQDEFYLIQGQNHELIVAGIPFTTAKRSLWNFTKEKNQVKFCFDSYNFAVYSKCRKIFIHKTITYDEII